MRLSALSISLLSWDKNTAMSKTLKEIRKEIDALDNQVHDLLMQRAALVNSVIAAKKKEGAQIVQPAREARMMRRLLSRHEGVLPKSTIVRIWRELVGSVAFLQSGFTVVVCSDEHSSAYWDMAKDYFGSSVPMKKAVGAQNSLAQVADGDATFAVLPWPDFNSDSAPWWGRLVNAAKQSRTLSIVCALPHGQGKKDDRDVFDRAVVVSKTKFMDSGDDVSFIAMEVSAKVSRDKLIEAIEQAGFDLMNMYSAAAPHDENSKIHLLEVRGFVDDTSSLSDALEHDCTICASVGGYPVIPDVR